MKIDILEMELVQGLPHWLSLKGRLFNKIEDIREKHRARYLAERQRARDDDTEK
jgi:hypothetical protein